MWISKNLNPPTMKKFLIMSVLVGIVVTSYSQAQKDRTNLVLGLAAEVMTMPATQTTKCDTFLVVDDLADKTALTMLKNYLPLLDSLFLVNDSIFNLKVDIEYRIDSLEESKNNKTKPTQSRERIALQDAITRETARRDSLQAGADNAADLYKGISYMARIFVRKLVGPVDRSRFCENAEILLKNGDVYTRVFAIRHLPW
jgi:hypothetical protein